MLLAEYKPLMPMLTLVH